MSGTTDIARRNGRTPAAQQAALAIQPGQLTWDEFQNAALNQLGLRNADNANRAVFLHQCQRTGLDPFARQIYMIERREKQGNEWVSKWTIQTGIEGWRTIRDRAERREGVRGIPGRFIYYDYDDNERKVWTRPEPPAAVEFTYTVRDSNGIQTPYTSVLRFDEYVQTKEQNGQRVPVAQWAVKPVHMLEKCTEADAYRKAFPQDYSGIHLDDAMPSVRPEDMTGEELDAAYAKVTQRQRVTAETIAARRQPVRATVVTTDAASGDVPPPPPSPEAASSPDAPVTATQVSKIIGHFKRLGWGDSEEDRQATLSATARLAGMLDLASFKGLTSAEADRVTGVLEGFGDGDAQGLMELLQDGVAPEDGA